VVVTIGAIRRAKLQLNCHHQQTSTQLFTGQLPFLSPNKQCQSTEGKITITILQKVYNKLQAATITVVSGASTITFGFV